MALCRLAAFALAVAFVSGCERAGIEMPSMPEMPTLSFISFSDPSELTVLSGAATAKGPDGYCVDREASRRDAGFAVIAPCAVQGETDELPARLAVLTVQFDPEPGPVIAGRERELVADLNQGLADQILGDGGDVTLFETVTDEALVVAHYRAAELDQLEGLSDDIWRAFADVGDRLVTVTLRAYPEAPVTIDDSRALLIDAVEVLRAANAG